MVSTYMKLMKCVYAHRLLVCTCVVVQMDSFICRSHVCVHVCLSLCACAYVYIQK